MSFTYRNNYVWPNDGKHKQFHNESDNYDDDARAVPSNSAG